eukprot:gene13623-8272_t
MRAVLFAAAVAATVPVSVECTEPTSIVQNPAVKIW